MSAAQRDPSDTPAEKRSLRILMLAQFYPPVIGGIEVHVAALARNLVRRGHEVTVATFATEADGPGDRVDEGVRIRALHGSVQRIGPLFSGDRRHAIPLPDPEVYLALRRLVAEFQPDIVHAHNWLGRSYLPLKRSVGVPYLVSLHDSSRICTQSRMMFRDAELCSGPSVSRCLSCCSVHFGAAKGPVTYVGNRLARRAEARRVDLFLPVSQAVAESNHLAEDGLPFEVVWNFSVDTESAPDCNDPRLAELPEEPFILLVGDIVADKGAGTLLDAYQTLASPPPLVLIGRISDETRASLPPGVTAVGIWPHELVLEAWRRSLFGTMPSIFLDPCPTTAFEAMAAGKAVVASARGGLLDQVADGVTGLLVTPGDPAALAAGMTQLLSDESLRARMGEAARERFLEKFQADVIVSRIEAIYLARARGIEPG